ncbi:hypothetical protein AHMF7605_24270 [Adhaeribacter arboris]|uniref:Lipocalin-like domain-containing protein n=1 Tax=Adhaeribacter arboris TaxID=2072846 RepID=A0A2T2YLL4_9BACT|nr:DUF6252 family protein [Adhaeribacter arboris]PSR56390.1 hypothetical protein AHMF7605_24270 [Adhaeribacter arboris]
MKNLLLVFFAVFLFSCENDDQAEPQTSLNIFSAKRNGVTWSGNTDVYLNNQSDTLTMWCIANRPNEAVLVVNIKFQGTGTYALTQNQAGYYTTVGRDVILSQYKPIPGSIGQLVISDYNAEKKQIAGSFELDLKNTWSSSGQDADTLHITAGNFTGIIRE